MNRHIHTPMYPGAMTPAQLIQKALTTAAAIATTAAFTAAFMAAAIILN